MLSNLFLKVDILLILTLITSKQWLKIKSSIVNTNNHLNGIFLLFDSLNSKISPDFRLIDIFSSHFSFHQANYKDKESKVVYNYKLNDIFTEAILNSKSIIVVSDASIKNNVTISITHIHSYSSPIKKTLHHIINITTIKAELFAIRCGINQAVQILGVIHIIIIINSIHLVQPIFDLTVYPYQLQSIAITKNLKILFNKQLTNSTGFWNCPSDFK